MRWKLLGPKLTDRAVAEFEFKSKATLPGDARWFLENVANGGAPDLDNYEILYVPVEDPIEQSEIHGLYGTGHQENYLNLADAVEDLPLHLNGMWPIAYDLGGDHYVLMLKGKPMGQVRLVTLDEYEEDGDSPTYHVARDIYQFAHRINTTLPTNIREDD